MIEGGEFRAFALLLGGPQMAAATIVDRLNARERAPLHWHPPIGDARPSETKMSRPASAVAFIVVSRVVSFSLMLPKVCGHCRKETALWERTNATTDPPVLKPSHPETSVLPAKRTTAES
jgi:hypothetical protein